VLETKESNNKKERRREVNVKKRTLWSRKKISLEP